MHMLHHDPIIHKINNLLGRFIVYLLSGAERQWGNYKLLNLIYIHPIVAT